MPVRVRIDRSKCVVSRRLPESQEGLKLGRPKRKLQAFFYPESQEGLKLLMFPAVMFATSFAPESQEGLKQMNRTISPAATAVGSQNLKKG